MPSLDIGLGSCTGSVTRSQGCWILAGVSSAFSGGQGQPRGPRPDLCLSVTYIGRFRMLSIQDRMVCSRRTFSLGDNTAPELLIS